MCPHTCTRIISHTHTHASTQIVYPHMLAWTHKHTHAHIHSGLLAGKFNRGAHLSDDPESSRVAWVEEDQSRSNQSHPSLQQWADKEMFWQLTDTLTEIAAAHGEL